MENNAHVNIDMPPGEDQWIPEQHQIGGGGQQRQNPAQGNNFQQGGWWSPPWMAGQMLPWMAGQMQMPPPRMPRVELPPFWIRDPRTWYTLAESKFQLAEVTDSRLKFNFVLPSLSEDTLVQVRHILHAADVMPDPYNTLKSRLLEIYTPSPLELGFQLLHSPELGDRRPSAMMASMLAMLPPGEADGILFKCIFLSRLPSDIRDHVSAQSKTLNSRELGSFADELWFARNSRGGHQVMAVTDIDSNEVEEITEVVVAIKFQPKKKGGGGFSSKKESGGGEQKKKWLCWRHATFRDKAYSCDSPKHCQFSGNE